MKATKQIMGDEEQNPSSGSSEIESHLTGLDTIATNLKTQDNRATANPIFAVQQRRRIYGLDTQWGGDVVWIDTGNDSREADEAERAELESKYERDYTEPDGWTRTAYIDIWEFVTACFTEQGCKDYIAANGHNLHDPRIYAYGSYRNREWGIIYDSILRAVNSYSAFEAMKAIRAQHDEKANACNFDQCGCDYCAALALADEVEGK